MASALIMLAGIYDGAQYGGSITAILIDLPGESSSAVTAIDGNQMAAKGQAGLALATAAIGSFVAGTVATLVLAVAPPPLAKVPLTFGAAENFSLVVLGLMFSVTLARGSVPEALVMVSLGILLGTVGQDLSTGTPRFTVDVRELIEGVDVMALAVGIFEITEIAVAAEEGAQGDVRADRPRHRPGFARGHPDRRRSHPVRSSAERVTGSRHDGNPRSTSCATPVRLRLAGRRGGQQRRPPAGGATRTPSILIRTCANRSAPGSSPGGRGVHRGWLWCDVLDGEQPGRAAVLDEDDLHQPDTFSVVDPVSCRDPR